MYLASNTAISASSIACATVANRRALASTSRPPCAATERTTPWYTAGRTLVTSSKDPVRAERCLRHYLSREPEISAPAHANAHWRLGQALEKQGKKDEAMAELAMAVKADPKLDDAKKDLKRLKG